MWNPKPKGFVKWHTVSSEQEAMHFGGGNPVSEPWGHHWATVSPPRDSIWVKPGTLRPHLSCAGAGWHQLSSWLVVWVSWLGLGMHLCLMLSHLLPGPPSMPARFLPGAPLSPAAPQHQVPDVQELPAAVGTCHCFSGGPRLRLVSCTSCCFSSDRCEVG